MILGKAATQSRANTVRLAITAPSLCILINRPSRKEVEEKKINFTNFTQSGPSLICKTRGRNGWYGVGGVWRNAGSFVQKPVKGRSPELSAGGARWVAGTAFENCYSIVWITVSARRATGFAYRGGYTGGGVRATTFF